MIPNYLEHYQVVDILLKLGLNPVDKGEKYAACCPIHSEKTPSFYVFKNSGYFNCFGCGAKGSLYDLVKTLTGKNIYVFLGIKNDYHFNLATTKTRTEKKLKDVNFELNGKLLDIFSNQQVLDYCWSIGLTNEFIKTFNVQYFQQLKIYPVGTAENDQKSFYNRIIIPCRYNGTIYNYECRDFTRRSSKKILYPSGSEPDILFNFDNLDLTKTVYIVEGIKGLSSIWSMYSKNVISTFGKVVKPYQKKLIKQIPLVCLVPDNDENKIDRKTGKAVDNVKELLGVYDDFYPFEYQIAYIPFKGKDPADLTRGQLKSILDNKKNSSEIIINNTALYKKNCIPDDLYIRQL